MKPPALAQSRLETRDHLNMVACRRQNAFTHWCCWYLAVIWAMWGRLLEHAPSANAAKRRNEP